MRKFGIAIALIATLYFCICCSVYFYFENKEITDEIELVIDYDYSGQALSKMVLCTNDGTQTTDWYEAYMPEGIDKIYSIHINDGKSLYNILLEARAYTEDLLNGDMRIKKVSIFKDGICINSCEGEELSGLFLLDDKKTYDVSSGTILWTITDNCERIVFDPLYVEKISGLCDGMEGEIIKDEFTRSLVGLSIVVATCIAVLYFLHKKKNENANLIGLSVIVAELIFLFCLLYHPHRLFEYDSNYYWYLGNSLLHGNKIRLYSFPDSYRGYFFPSYLALAMKLGIVLLGDSRIGFFFLHSVLISAWLVIINPFSFLKNTSIRNHEKTITIFGVLGVLFLLWSDYVVLPLSDIFAFMMYSTGLVLLLALGKNCDINNSKIYLCVAGGGVLYAAYNTRTVYAFPILCSIIYILIKRFKGIKSKVIYGTIILTGMLIFCAPQVMANYRHHGIISPRVHTEYTFGDNLSVVQLYAGINCNRYETVSGQSPDYEEYGGVLIFANELTEKIDQTEKKSILGYLSLVISHPIEFFGLYMKHLVNGLTPMYNSVYISCVSEPKLFMLVITLSMVTLCTLMINAGLSANRFSLFASILVCLPSIMAIPGQMEVRFMLPLAIWVYGYVIGNIANGGLKKIFYRQGFIVSVLIVLGTSILWLEEILITFSQQLIRIG